MIVNPPSGAVLLAAGSGSRLSALTAETHKSLLPIGGKPALQHILDALLDAGVGDIVVVTGDKQETIHGFIAESYPNRATIAFNQDYATDTNILSLELGVEALRKPNEGYLVVETDLVLEPLGWKALLDVGEQRNSFWATRGVFSESLLGGVLRADPPSGRVLDLAYVPEYSTDYLGWEKLLGVLYVGPGEVARDREYRREGIRRTTAQYYMMPWIENLPNLPCYSRPLGEVFAYSYNDLEAYQQICDSWEALT